ncbi:hypothetical protein BIW11_07995 [Tropilaelaps mercedesae]|uniref:Uncharacterized protein n=1 Tax=Tropilaelaps mercedesae TaxID=418985 RepID=A0A1V9XRH9_9ACAR|nr:hypothetical protein BIW11_07995 [Tropilaelaps mercedesae]
MIVPMVPAIFASGGFTRSFQINGEDMSVLFSLNLTTAYQGSPRSRILANLKDRSGDCVAVFRGPEGNQGCVCCCTRCAQTRLVKANLRSMQSTSSILSQGDVVFLNPQESLTVESPPGSVIGHIALHHDFYGVYNKGMLQLIYSIPFKPNNGAASHTVTLAERGSQSFVTSGNREQGFITRCNNPHSTFKVSVRPPQNTHSSHHKLLLIATAICMFAMEAERTPRPLEWLGCVCLRDVLEEGWC